MTIIEELASLAGIETSYVDIWGNRKAASEETLALLLQSLKIPITSEDERKSSMEALMTERNGLAPVYVIVAEHASDITVHGATKWELKGEDDKPLSGAIVQDKILLPPLKMGYYDLNVFTGSDEKHCTLLVSPPACWLPDKLSKGERVWGLSAQLYALRSEQNWGIGDFNDLKILIEKAAALHADVIGLNPVSALFPSNPVHYAPYGPSSRLFLNIQYIDVTGVDEFKGSQEAQTAWNDKSFQDELLRLRESKLVDYPAVAVLKERVLKILFKAFRTKELPKGFKDFRKKGGETLKQHAVFDALTDYFYTQHKKFIPWQEWPSSYRNPSSPDVEKFAKNHIEQVLYFIWLQWLADTQLSKAQDNALSRGMAIGLYRDLAVGVDKAGAELWMQPEMMMDGVSIGAPSDEYNPQGQNWGLPAPHPFAMRKSGYSFFRALLTANMRHARALRIDHAFGLCRLFLIPEGTKVGTYLNYAFDEMLAVLKIESHRNRCLVVGEDLGTFPPQYKKGAAEAGLLSYKLLYFERDEKGNFIPPDRYPFMSLSTLSTHDLPTYKGWVNSADIEERAALSLYPNEELLAKDRKNRPEDVKRLAQALIREKLHNDPNKIPDISASEKFLASSAAAIVMVQLEDVLELVEQTNIPTTTTERPNWRMKLPETIERIAERKGFDNVAQRMNEGRVRQILQVPNSTYRLQFHKDFTFDDAVEIIPYLAKLGVSHVYASPYFTARPGSQHGYDITDHNAFNAELGGEEGFERFHAALKSHGLGHILDFVPNHMGVGGADNQWWLSMLEWGRNSPFSAYFDIDWKPRMPGAESKLIVPFLGNHYGTELSHGKLELKLDVDKGTLGIWYGPHCFPICPKDYSIIIDSEKTAGTFKEGEMLKQKIKENGTLQSEAQKKITEINSNHTQLHELLERQHYRLVYWRVAANDINYRRFFDITELAGIRPEEPVLFDIMHRTVLSLLHDNKLQGLRIDHIDGLADPKEYCQKLREKAGASAYLIVEKILGQRESLEEGWSIQGTSGYDALNIIAGVLVDAKGEKAIDRIYKRFTGINDNFSDLVFRMKTLMLETTLESELQVLSFLAKSIADINIYTRDYTRELLKQVIKDIIACFPVYRTYVTEKEISVIDIRTIDQAVSQAKKRSFLADLTAYNFVGSLLKRQDTNTTPETLTFMRKFQQLSGPVMAKGVEDTSFYRYNRLLSLNEVGGNPEHFGISLSAFHIIQAQRAKRWPYSMIATATHDTKHGEDMRMRLHVLAEIPREWFNMLRRWSKFNRTRHKKVDGRVFPLPNDEYFIYQTLLGSLPFALMENPSNKEQAKVYTKRVSDYMIKALREAKAMTSWNNPYEAYEHAVTGFIEAILNSDKSSLFLEDFSYEAKRIAHAGVVKSLSQTIMKFTLPGVPDIYQGSESWDLNLVDPDNRRPVNFSALTTQLDNKEPLSELLTHWQDGLVKQKLINILLSLRQTYPMLFRQGEYEPLPVEGKFADTVLAFSRTYESKKLIVLTPITSRAGNKLEEWPIGEAWGDTFISIFGVFHNILNNKKLSEGAVRLADLCEDFPMAVLLCDEATQMH